MATLEEAKAFLQKEAPDGTNLYDHLADVLLKILVERPENLHETFEHLSVAVRQQRYAPPPPPPPPAADGAPDIGATRPFNEKWCQAGFDLLKIKDDEGSTERPTGVADLLDEANMLEWAGVGFSKGETFRLSLALQQLARTNGTSTLRFWGKILGIGADYYIAEGELPTPHEPEDPAAEDGAAGVNKFAYWAMKDDGEYKWVQLPHVTQAQIQTARKLRRFVRGDLDAKVRGHPPFPGTEKHFLRAQIARISASTVVCPSGYFQVSEEGEIEPAEDPQIKTAEELGDLDGWVHFSKEINARYGRATPLPPRTGEDGEELPWEDEEFAPPLRTISEDHAGSWRINRLPGTLIPSVGEVAVLRSLIWPGAVSIGVGKKFLSVYVGHGVKFSAEPFQPPPPLPLQVGFGVGPGASDEAAADDKPPGLRFDMLVEQKDLLEDPSPPQEEDE